MAVDISGTWKLVRSSDNYDELLKSFGLGVMKRKLVHSLKPTMKIAQEGDRFEVEIEVPTKTTKNSFTIGEEFESEIALEQTGRAIARIEGNRLILEGTMKKGDPFKVIRYIVNDELVQEIHIGEITVKRWFRKL